MLQLPEEYLFVNSCVFGILFMVTYIRSARLLPSWFVQNLLHNLICLVCPINQSLNTDIFLWRVPSFTIRRNSWEFIDLKVQIQERGNILFEVYVFLSILIFYTYPPKIKQLLSLFLKNYLKVISAHLVNSIHMQSYSN